MLINTTTLEFRNFLLLLLKGIKLHQKIGIFYDLLYIKDSNIRRRIELDFYNIFKDFYNISFFSDYIGGFITNKEGNHFRKIKTYTFVIFFNFDYLNARHRSLLDEFRYAKIEYIIISPGYIDIMAYTPFIYLNLNLNDINVIKIFQLYLKTYIEQNLKNISEINNKYHKLLVNKNKSKLFYFIGLSLFLLSLIKKKKILYYQLNYGFFLYNKKYKKINFKTFLKSLLSSTLVKKEFLYTILTDPKYFSIVKNLEFLGDIKEALKVSLLKLYYKLHKYNFDLKKVCF